MTEIIMIVIATSVITALSVVGIGYGVFLWKIKPQLEAQLSETTQEIEERVKEGVLSAGTELLPEFGSEVKEGFSKAFTQWPTSEVEKMAKTGANIVEDGLNLFLGKPHK